MKHTSIKSIVMAVILAVNINLFAQNTGPAAPEAMSFEPVDAANMVNMNTGDLVYSIPIINIPGPGGGYPLALSYHGGIALDQEASWVGLGWNINPGAINRGVMGIPDDFRDANTNTFMFNEGGSYTTRSVGVGINIDGVSVGATLTWNDNWSQWTFAPYVGLGVGDPSLNAGLVVGTEFGVTAGVGRIGGLGHVGVSIGTWGAGISASLGYGPASIKANWSASEVSFGVSMGKSFIMNKGADTKVGSNASVGVSLSSSGNISGGATVGVSNFTSEQSYNMNGENIYTAHSSWVVPLVFLNLSYDNIRWWHFDNMNTTSDGLLYLSESYVKNDGADVWRDNPAQHESYISDAMVMPYSRLEINNRICSETFANLMLPGADNYMVNAQGLNGNMTLKYYEPALLVGQTKVLKSFNEKSTDNHYDQIHREVFYAATLGLCDAGNCPDNDGEIKRMPQDINPYFYFDNAPTGSINVSALTWNNFNTAEQDPYWGAYNLESYSANYRTNSANVHNGRIAGGNFVNYYTNQQIIDNDPKLGQNGFLETTSIVEAEGRDNTNYFVADGIGAFSITSNDGVTYHYSLPVYQFEEYGIHQKSGSNDFYITTQEQAYAYTWLLTAITGPDFIDKGTIGMLDEEDEGYWVNFEYGKWTDAYYWKTPYGGAEYERLGRKQIYYLDKVLTKTHTAYFIKSLREDGYSSDISRPAYQATGKGATNISTLGNLPKGYRKPITFTTTPQIEHPPQEAYMYYNYATSDHSLTIDLKRTYPLKLDKIILVKNSDDIKLRKDGSVWDNNLSSVVTRSVDYQGVKKVYNSTSNIPDELSWSSYQSTYGCLASWEYISYAEPCQQFIGTVDGPVQTISYQNYYANNILDNRDYSPYSAMPEILKEIKFNYYESGVLCKGAPNSPEGKLSLKSIELLGKNEFPMMPPYYFEYYNPNELYNENDKDDWGFHKTAPESWSLKNIITPTGAKLEIILGPDSFRSETVFGEIRNEKFDTEVSGPNLSKSCNNNNLLFVCTVPEGKTFDEFFGVTSDHRYWISGEYQLKYAIYANGNYIEDEIMWLSVTPKLLEVSKTPNSNEFSFLYYVPDAYPEPGTVAKPIEADFYKLLISGVEILNESNGGGVRVNEIRMTDGVSSYSTYYNYNIPGSTKTSGVTSYTPGHKGELIQLPTEVPAPCVYYEYVTVSDNETSMTYQYEVPQTSLNNEDPEFSMGNQLKVTDIQDRLDPNNPWLDFTTNSAHEGKGYARSAIIEDRTSQIGRLNSVATYNNVGDLITSQKYVYDDNPSVGISQETYYYQKNVVDWGVSHTTSKKSFFYVSTTKKTIPSILRAVHTYGGGLTHSVFNSDFDIHTGAALKTTTVLHKEFADNMISPDEITQKIEESTSETLPAYLINEYAGTNGSSKANSGMASKVYNLYNKNMLTQTAATLTKKNGQVIGAGIQTWKGDWNNYVEWDPTERKHTFDGTDPVDVNIWRKHKTFAWDGVLDSDGTYGSDFNSYNTIDKINQNWGTITSESPSVDWIKTSEVVRYDHYSTPVEVTDINGDYAATKKDPYHEYTVATAANARHSQFAHCGFEYEPYLNQGETGTQVHYPADRTISSTEREAHTGNYYMPVGATKTGVSYTIDKLEAANYEYPLTFVASVWVYSEMGGLPSPMYLGLKGPGTSGTQEAERFGDWLLYTNTFTLDAPPASDIEFKVTNDDTQFRETIYIDDFRVAPYDAAVISYAYDNAGNVIAISNNDNMATKYVYDDAGRLTGTFIEKPDGFARVTKHDYNYAPSQAPDVKAYLAVDQTQIHFPNTGQTIKVKVTSDTDWQVSGVMGYTTNKPLVATINNKSGTGNGEFEIVCSPNNVDVYCKAKIEITGTGADKVTIYLEQDESSVVY